MAKLGRYSADRKKIKALSADHTATVAECGTIFTIPGGNTAVVLTLPEASAAGKGWWCKVALLADDPGATSKVLEPTVSANTVIAQIITLTNDTASTGVADGGCSGVAFTDNAACAGATVECISTGSKWLMTAIAAIDGAITIES